MKKLASVLLTALLALSLIGCASGSAENAVLTEQYLPEGVEFIRTEKDDGFTEHKYRDASGSEYTLTVDSANNVRVLEYDAAVRSTAERTVLTGEDAFAVITAAYPEAVLITAAEDRDDGRYEWNILFADKGILGFYELDAATGAVLDYDIFYAVGEVIDPAAIITANIPDAGITEVSLDTDNGRLYIEGEAASANGIMEFTIDADTGTVVELEHDD